MTIDIASTGDTTPPTTPVLGEHTFDEVECFWQMTWQRSTDDVTPRRKIAYDALQIDELTGLPYVLDYDVSIGTGEGRTSFTTQAVQLRAADESGNVSGLSEPTTTWSP